MTSEKRSNSVIDQTSMEQPRGHILFPEDPAHSHAGILARFLTDLRYEDIPDDVVHKAKLLTLDTVGCIIAGTDTVLGQKILAAYGTREQTDGCSVADTSLRLAPSLSGKVAARYVSSSTCYVLRDPNNCLNVGDAVRPFFDHRFTVLQPQPRLASDCCPTLFTREPQAKRLLTVKIVSTRRITAAKSQLACRASSSRKP
ncbi:hypothetical protein QF000_000563 [Paraburkholderia atlantica]|uniref:MmgE/PrpD family protein n=1 Tax=Paraburkholderia atlantica TaxID=2654982 RepID=UPI003D19FF82